MYMSLFDKYKLLHLSIPVSIDLLSMKDIVNEASELL